MKLTPEQRRVARGILEHETDSFVDLVRKAGLNPRTAFVDADLRGVDFGADDLSGYDFSGADLSGASLTNALGLTAVEYSSTTVWPNGWHPSKHGLRNLKNPEPPSVDAESVEPRNAMPRSRKTCFVILPSGSHNSKGKPDQETWRIATAARTLIIESAAQRLNSESSIELVCFRAESDGNHISEVTFQHVYRNDLVIAVLFKSDDRVSYEIGLAHAISRPVIILKHRKYALPNHLRIGQVVEFSDAAIDNNETEREDTISELCRKIYAHISTDGLPSFSTNPFESSAAPFSRCIPYDRFRISYQEMSLILLEADREVWLAADTLHSMFYKSSFVFQSENVSLSTLLTSLLLSGRNVNVTIMDEVNLANSHLLRFRENLSNDEAVDVRNKLHLEVSETEIAIRKIIDSITHYSTRKRTMSGTLKFTKVRYGAVRHRVIMSEQIAYITPIFHSSLFTTGPSFKTYPKSKTELIDDHEYSQICLYKEARDDLLLLQRVNPTLSMLPDGSLVDGILATVSSTNAA